MGAHVFLISLYAATAASFMVLGVSLMADVSPMGAAVRAGIAFLAFTVLGLLARAAFSGATSPAREVRGQQVDFRLPATEAMPLSQGVSRPEGAQATDSTGRRREEGSALA